MHIAAIAIFVAASNATPGLGPTRAPLDLLELPAYTAWCASIVIQAGEEAESQQADAWAAFMRAVDTRLVNQSIAASGLPYVARAVLDAGGEGTADRITQDACIVVPSDLSLVSAGKNEPPLSRRSVAALETVAIRVCAAGAPTCLGDLRAELRASLPAAPRETIDMWPFRIVPFARTAEDRAAVRSALIATDLRPLAAPVTVDGTIVPDVPERGMDGKPLLRPLRTAPTGKVERSPASVPVTLLVAITIPPDAAAAIRESAK